MKKILFLTLALGGLTGLFAAGTDDPAACCDCCITTECCASGDCCATGCCVTGECCVQ